MVKIMYAWLLIHFGCSFAFNVGILALELPFLEVAPAFTLWQTFFTSVLIPLTYYWHDEELRTKVAKMTKERIQEYQRR